MFGVGEGMVGQRQGDGHWESDRWGAAISLLLPSLPAVAAALGLWRPHHWGFHRSLTSSSNQAGQARAQRAGQCSIAVCVHPQGPGQGGFREGVGH